jgi:ribose 5-phosphate isomerase B
MPAFKRVIIAADRPYDVARFIVDYVRSKGYEVIPMGALKDGNPVPWPDAGYMAAKSLARGEADTAILMCYTGTGITIVANKIKGVWAAPCIDAQTAKLARLLNNANALTLSARLITEELAKEIIDAWFSIEEPDPLRADRFKRVKEIEEMEFK